MEDILKADIFFFIATIGFSILFIFWGIIAYFLFKIIRALQRIMNKIEAQSEEIALDITNLRNFMYKGSIISSLFGILMNRKKKDK